MVETQADQNMVTPLVKSVLVNLSIADAFSLFTEGYARWWPLASHSVGLEHAQTCVLQAGVGGRIYEVIDDGRQVEWGRVLVWQPPHRLVFSWYPGRQPETAQQVEVTFQPQDGRTLVQLTHTGWEALGELAQAHRSNYDTGWDYVLGKYTGCADARQ
jgi:uncharacterized protein YndB with AHSA1/START domain